MSTKSGVGVSSILFFNLQKVTSLCLKCYITTQKHVLLYSGRSLCSIIDVWESQSFERPRFPTFVSTFRTYWLHSRAHINVKRHSQWTRLPPTDLSKYHKHSMSPMLVAPSHAHSSSGLYYIWRERVLVPIAHERPRVRTCQLTGTHGLLAPTGNCGYPWTLFAAYATYHVNPCVNPVRYYGVVFLSRSLHSDPEMASRRCDSIGAQECS